MSDALRKRSLASVDLTSARTQSSARNAAAGAGAQAALLILGLVGRAVFVHELGVEFVGIDTLLVSVLTILMVADLGMAGAVMAAMYRPLADGDHARVASLARQLRTLYLYVAGAVLVAGCFLAIVLPSIANTSLPDTHLRLYFLVLLAGVVGNYALSARTNVIVADQRSDVVSVWTLGVQSLRQVLQIVVLVAWGSYLAYLILFVVGRIGLAAFLWWTAGRRYPYLKGHAARLGATERRTLLKSVQALAVYRVAGVVLNNMTAVCVVALLGTTAGGRYANYLLLVSAAIAVLETAFLAVTANVGHLVTTSTAAQTRRVFAEITWAAGLLFGVPAVVMTSTLADTVTIWLGREHVLSTSEEMALIGGFLVYGMTMPVLVFRTATGLFQDAKYVLLATAAVNVILIVALNGPLELLGILIAAPVARLLVSYWVEPSLLMRRHIGGGMGQFWRQHLSVYIAVAASILAMKMLPLDRVGTLWLRLVCEAGAAAVISAGLLTLVAWHSPAFRFLLSRARGLVRGENISSKTRA
jgi:O-antigen/teichoic acid export membrane protein